MTERRIWMVPMNLYVRALTQPRPIACSKPSIRDGFKRHND
jgi:hypothetical protein